MENLELEVLLNKSCAIVHKHQRERREKGEDFNVFSILGMENNETKTHSAMLVALLDPKGNHYHNEQFLELFLKEIGYNHDGENLLLTKVKAEHHLGKISKDYGNGGFIDILITFGTGKAIAIENKIDAPDQPRQMYRYSLFKGGTCDLYYLSKLGTEPSIKSLYKLTAEDYSLIAYNDHILKWLAKCLLVAKPGSTVFNAIKQYQILIKNITYTMAKPIEDNLNNLIVNNLEGAKYIHAHYQKAVDSIKEKLRVAIVDEINKMQIGVHARKEKPINHTYSKIWVSSDSLHKRNIQIGIESFSGNGNNNGQMFIGVFDRKNEHDALRDGDYRLSSYWPIVSDIRTKDDKPLNLSSVKILESLSTDRTYFEETVETIIEQVKQFVTIYDA